MLDGRYSAFGYTVEGADLLKDVKEGYILFNNYIHCLNQHILTNIIQ